MINITFSFPDEQIQCAKTAKIDVQLLVDSSGSINHGNPNNYKTMMQV